MIFFIIMIVFSPFTAVIPAVYAGDLLIKKKLKIEKNYWNIGLFLLFVYSVFSAIANKSILSLLASVGLFLYLALSILFQNYFINENRINEALRYLVYISGLSAFSGIMERISFKIMGVDNHRIFSTFGNPNMAGAWFSSIILIIIYLKSIDKVKKHAEIYNVIMILNLIALLLTESSGAFVAMIGSLFVYYLLKKDNKLKNIILTFVIVSFIVIMFFVVQSKVTSVTPMDEIVVSFNSRYDIWIGSFQMFNLKPILGWGLLGTFEHGNMFMYNNGNSIHSHNLWLTFLVSVGAVGFIIYLYIKWNLIKDMTAMYKNGKNILPLLAALNSIVIIQGIVDCSLYAPQLGILFIATGAITYNIANNKVIKKNKIVKISKYPRGNNIAV